jgi:formylglycine-generating enzyme required for sulfatase activity
MSAKLSWKSRAVCAAVVCVSLASFASADTFGTGTNQFNIDFVTISGATNPTSGDGIVNNDYRIGTYEITNDQWDKFELELGVPVTGDPSFAYNEDPHFTGANVPTNKVSWSEAAQFVNWLNTSTGHQAAYKFTGTQGQSDYTLDTWSAAEADNGTNLYRHKDAKYYLPTEDEWVKAGYWNGTSLQTYSNASPGDLVSGSPDPAKWNYSPSAGNEPWDVGSGAEELNGTFDMMGNVWEWMESPYSDLSYGVYSGRGERGGSYNYNAYDLSSSGERDSGSPDIARDDLGFRVASEVPEPASLSLLAVGALALIKRRGIKGDRLLFIGMSGHLGLEFGYDKDITRANIGCCESRRQSRQWPGDAKSSLSPLASPCVRRSKTVARGGVKL